MGKVTSTSWTEGKINLNVLGWPASEKRKLLQEMETRKIQFVGRSIRHNNFITNILEGKC